MRLIRATLAVLVLALATTAAAHPLMTKSQARAIVRDVNLKASDMPDYDSAKASQPTAADRRADTRLARCAGSVPLSRAVAWGPSPVFSHGNLDDYVVFGSTTIVYPKATQLRRDLRALRTARWRDCMRAAIAQSGAASGIVATITVTQLDTDVNGVFGYRFRIDAASSSQSSTSYADLFFMGARTTETRVVVNSHPAPPAQQKDDEVIRILKTRLNARVNPDAIL